MLCCLKLMNDLNKIPQKAISSMKIIKEADSEIGSSSVPFNITFDGLTGKITKKNIYLTYMKIVSEDSQGLFKVRHTITYGID